MLIHGECLCLELCQSGTPADASASQAVSAGCCKHQFDDASDTSLSCYLILYSKASSNATLGSAQDSGARTLAGCPPTSLPIQVFP